MGLTDCRLPSPCGPSGSRGLGIFTAESAKPIRPFMSASQATPRALFRVRALRGPAAPRERVVEVLALRAHAADVERELRLERVAQRLDVVADEDARGRRDLEALGRRRERVVETLGVDEDWEPPVRDLKGERHVLRA